MSALAMSRSPRYNRGKGESGLPGFGEGVEVEGMFRARVPSRAGEFAFEDFEDVEGMCARKHVGCGQWWRVCSGRIWGGRGDEDVRKRSLERSL
jgi:hypothetical protein